MELLITFLVILGPILVGIYLKLTLTHWKRKNIPYISSTATIGSFVNDILHKKDFATSLRYYYAWAKANSFKGCGFHFLLFPVYMPLDPKLIKHILLVDFTIFINRGVYYNKKADPLTANIFSLDGQDWQNLRVKLTPTFTSGKMKMMFHTVAGCGMQLKKSIDRLALHNDPFDIREAAGQFTTDVIGSCAFGLNCNSFQNPNSEFLQYSKRYLKTNLLRAIRDFLALTFPRFVKMTRLSVMDKSVTKFFLRIVKDTIEYREKNMIVRNDFLQLLLNIRNNHVGNKKHQLSLEEIAAQAFLFFIAGYETSSSTMAFCLYELSVNLDIQDKVRKEIKTVLEEYKGNVTYDAIMELKYMRQVIDETLRKYPPLPVLFRKTVTKYEIPESNVVLDKGTWVFIPSIGLHYDEDYFPDPEKFDPERFSHENKNKIQSYSYLPFGEGPRNCIGLRFGIMQVKVGLVYLLKDYLFSLNKKTSSPLKMDPKSFMMASEGGIWLNAIKVNA